MQFIHRPYRPKETVAALATPPGEGGIAIIRVCGGHALDVVEKIFSGPIKSYSTHTAHLGKIFDMQGNFLDQALVLVMLGSRSYAGEDTVEIQCHGGGLVARKVLQAAIDAGARLANPGEFTFKAFMNGKIDLAQAEAVQELIASKNQWAMQSASLHLEGRLSSKIEGFQKELFNVAAILEAWVDFPEEGIEFATMEEIASLLEESMLKMKNLALTFEDGKILSHGINVCLAGRPNVGKSSLMNLLLDKDRAIVTPIAGTTRDLLVDDVKIRGLNVRLTDTAGIRNSDEFIEIEGIKRSKNAIREADLVLFVLDASEGFCDYDRLLLQELNPEKTLVIWNKCDKREDLIIDVGLKHCVKMSAKEGFGLDELHKKIDALIWDKGPPSKDEVVITNIRHKEALDRAIESCGNVLSGLLSEQSPEFLSFDMRQSLQELGTIIGQDISESILTSIFSKFCIGK
jgi:tRNA modification GTPase